MNDDEKKPKSGGEEKRIISHRIILLGEFNKELRGFLDSLKTNYRNPLNNSDDLDYIARLYDLTGEIYSNHLDIEILLLNAEIQKEEMFFLKEKLRQSECLVRYAVEYQKGIKVSIANDLAFSYHEKYEN